MNPKLSVGPVFAALFFAPLCAQEKELDPQLVQSTAARLSAESAKDADDTMRSLIRGDRASVPLLRAVLAAEPNAEAKRRAQQALRICEIDAPIENGLKVGLAADVGTLKVGETIRMTTTLCNVSDEPIALYLGMSYSGNVLENGLSLARQVTPTDKGEIAWQKAGLTASGFCATGAESIVVKIEPWTSQQFVAKLEFRTERHFRLARNSDGPHLASQWVSLPLAPDQPAVRLQTRLDVDAEEAQAAAAAFGKPAIEPNWHGTIRSNVIEIAVGEKRGG